MVGPRRTHGRRSSSRKSSVPSASYRRSKESPTERYIQGKISEATWKRHMGEERRKNAPSKSEVLKVMEQREIAQGKSTDWNKTYNGYTNWDTWNTMLLMDNHQQSSRWMSNWSKNFNQKIKNGTFDPVQAEKVVDKYIVPAARGRKSLSWAVGKDFTCDPEIDPKKVNKAEIVRHIIEYND